MVFGLYVNLFIMAVLILLIFADHVGPALIYNGNTYPVEFKNGRVSCKLFGAVDRYKQDNDVYNVFGYELKIEYAVIF